MWHRTPANFGKGLPEHWLDADLLAGRLLGLRVVYNSTAGIRATYPKCPWINVQSACERRTPDSFWCKIDRDQVKREMSWRISTNLANSPSVAGHSHQHPAEANFVSIHIIIWPVKYNCPCWRLLPHHRKYDLNLTNACQCLFQNSFNSSSQILTEYTTRSWLWV